MKIEEYLLQPISKRFEIANSEITWNSPFWLERLNTAITKKNPIVLMIFPQLKDEYWDLLSFKNSLAELMSAKKVNQNYKLN